MRFTCIFPSFFILSLQIEDLSGDLEEKDQALAKAREALHKAKLQKYQVCVIVHFSVVSLNKLTAGAT